jgi:hypothetical protein
MKFLRALALLAIGAAGLTACGDGGIQSPDFTAELVGLSLSTSDADATRDPPAGDPPQYNVAAGRRVTLDVIGTFTTPPGSDEETEDRPTSADFTIEPEDGGTIDGDEFRGTRPGQVTVTAERDGEESNPIIFNVSAAVIESIEIEPVSATIPVGASADFNAVGVFSDDERRPVAVNWTVDPADVVTLSNASNSTTVRATTAPGATAGDTAVLTATRPASTGVPELTDTANITIDDRVVIGLVEGSAECTPPAIGIGFSAQCTVDVRYSDNSTEPAGTLVTWSSPQEGTLVDVDPATGMVEGLSAGTATITATLTGAGTPDEVSTTLTVLASANARCQQPLVAQGAVATGTTSALCVACSVANPGLVVDDDAATFASIDTTLGLLFGTATLNVNAQPTTFAGTAPVGFVVAQPPGLLLSAELLSSLTVSTVDSGNTVIESGSTNTRPLTVTLLGTIGGQDAALISFVPTQPFNGLALTFNAGVASVLPTINVFQACAVANPAAAP